MEGMCDVIKKNDEAEKEFDLKILNQALENDKKAEQQDDLEK